MSLLSSFDGGSGGNIMSCFGTILARSWYMADEPPSHSDLGAKTDWLLLLLSDQNRVRAAGLHAAYNQCRAQITDDKPALETLEQQHYNMQCSVTPIHQLPAEIMMEIFHIVIDVGRLRGGLMNVCRRWYKTIEGMASLWASLDVVAESTPESVSYFLSRAGTHALAVKIDINKEISMEERLQLSLAMAGNRASQWQTLTIASLPRDGPDAQSNHVLFSTQFQPMRQLRHLVITEPVLSPLLRALLQNIATEAVGTLMSMEIHSSSAVHRLLQTGHSSIWRSLTTFIAKVPKMNEPVDLLPHFMQLEVLELTNLLLSIVDNGSLLPLAHTLHHLYLKSVSIQWMGGRVFSQLENCTIIAPLTGPSLHHDVQLPTCTQLHFENWNISPIGQFVAPVIDHLRVKSNAWSPYTGNVQVVQLVRAGFGMTYQPRSISFSVTCKEKVLLAVLQLVPELLELKLDLPRPSALGEHFFTRLLAKPGNQITHELSYNWRELFRANRTEWRCTICPYLKVLELKYQQWLRPGYNDDFLPPLLALAWSREKTAVPLQLDVHYKTSMQSWESLDSTLPQVIEVISYLRVTHSGQVDYLSLETKTWKSAVFENALTTPFLHRLQGLEIYGPIITERQVLNVLPSFHGLRVLALSSVHIPPLDVDPPLVHTLRKLSLRNSTLAWMDGLVFTQLQKFSVDERGWPVTFKRKVGMPACSHIVFQQHKLKTLPSLQSSFQLPLLNTYEFPGQWNHSEYDKRGISALERIHAKAFGFRISSDYQRLLKLLRSKDEVEHLDLVFSDVLAYTLPTTAVGVLTGFSVTDPITGKPHCPNMKELGLQFMNLMEEDRERVIQSCMRMMSNRGLAGHPLEKCCLWWNFYGWKEPASLVLVMENGTARIEGSDENETPLYIYV
jgi:hypothetical protein